MCGHLVIFLMNNQTFLHELAGILGVPTATLADTTRLADCTGWDSMGKMAALTLIDTDLNLPVPYDTLQKCQTVGDLLAFVAPHLEA